jgi:hypothetical protein
MYNTYNSEITLETFAQMALIIVEEKINTIIELFFLQHNKSATKSDKSDLVKGILSLPVGILQMTLKSAHKILIGI